MPLPPPCIVGAEDLPVGRRFRRLVSSRSNDEVHASRMSRPSPPSFVESSVTFRSPDVTVSGEAKNQHSDGISNEHSARAVMTSPTSGNMESSRRKVACLAVQRRRQRPCFQRANCLKRPGNVESAQPSGMASQERFLCACRNEPVFLWSGSE